jgi:ERCC4-type nuclease
MISVAHEEVTNHPEIIDHFARERVFAERTVMPYGDYAWIGRGEGGKEVHVGIERKEIHDLLSSLRSGRLAGHQLEGMVNTYEFRWLLVEGEWRVDRKGLIRTNSRGVWRVAPGHWTEDELTKQLATLAHRGGLNLWRTRDLRHSAKWMAAYYRWWTDTDFDDHKSHLVIYHPPSIVPVSQFRQTVTTLPGIGFKLSILVEGMFGTLRRAFTANAAAWEAIPGVGRKTSVRIQEVLDGRE